MKTKCVPAIMTLSAGLIDCIISIYCHLDSLAFLKRLLLVLILFYLIGWILQFILDIGIQKMEDKIEDEEEKKGELESDDEMKMENEEVD